MSETQTESIPGFDTFKLGRSLQRGIEAAGFTEPRPIQVHTIPAATNGRDILGLAQTGTGKTAAFSLPVLEKLMTTPSRSGDPRAQPEVSARKVDAKRARRWLQVIIL